MTVPWNPYPAPGTRVTIVACAVDRHSRQEGVVMESCGEWGRAIKIGGESCHSPFVERVKS